MALAACHKVDTPDAPPEEEKTELEKLLSQKQTGSPLKKQYSDYVTDFKETMLMDFDELVESGLVFDGCDREIDTEYQQQGKGALRLTVNGDYRDNLARLFWRTDPVTPIFHGSATGRNKCTLKLWLFVDNVENIRCDHDSKFGDFADQATFFFRAFDNEGRVWNWNHTITGNGWHEVELSFNVHNGYDSGFNFEHIVSFGMLTSARQGTVLELDALRLVEYSTDYKKPAMKQGERLISNAEYDALDGAIVQEWYGASYDTVDKVEGKSSLRNRGDGSVSDFRTIVANLDIQLNYNEDVLVFWLKLKDLHSVKNLFIELNEVQDTHEYEQNFTMAKLQDKGLTHHNTWAEIVIPLTEFKKNLAPGYASGENIILHNFRLVAATGAVSEFDLHVDNIYITTRAALGIR